MSMERRLSLVRLSAIAFALTLVGGCDDSPATPRPDALQPDLLRPDAGGDVSRPKEAAVGPKEAAVGDQGAPSGTLISAASGGSVNAPGGVTVTFPPGALAKDTLITAAEIAKGGLPDEQNLVSVVVELGPSGLSFAKPVTVAFPKPASPQGQLKVATMAKGGTAWTDLPTSEQGGKLQAEVDHFSLFTIHLVPASTGCQPNSGCGGDPTGTWGLPANGTACLSAPSAVVPGCPAATATLTLDLTAFTLELKADKSYSVDMQGTAFSTVTLPKSCLPATVACTAIDAGCTDTGTSCVCKKSEPLKNENPTGGWSVQGNTMNLKSSSGSSGTDYLFCVSGGKLELYSKTTSREGDETFAVTLVKK